MKKAANVFAVIGMIANIVVAILDGVAYGVGAGIIFGIIAFIGVCIGLAVIGSSEKKVGLGVAAILFVNPLCGIFYLCWDGR